VTETARTGPARARKRPSTLTDVAIERIKEMIVSGELAPASRLPRESDLARRLGVSRNTLREAVRALSFMRVLEVRQGDGTYVTTLEPDLLLESMTFFIDLSRDQTILQLFGVRRILEAAAAAMAAARITADELAHLERLIDALSPDKSVEETVAVDVEFHAVIVNASGNPVLASLIENLSSQTLRARIWRGLADQRSFEQTKSEHRAIYEALVGRDAELAGAVAATHIRGVEAWLAEAITTSDSARAYGAPARR
jgi:DNA-binding FadR family transcriptional regulator